MDIETRAALQVLVLPPIDSVVFGVSANPTEDEKATYQRWCDARIREELNTIEFNNSKVVKAWDETVERRPLPDNYKRAMLRTHYPYDDTRSEDVVGLDDAGNVEVIDEGNG